MKISKHWHWKLFDIFSQASARVRFITAVWAQKNPLLALTSTEENA